VIESQSDDQLKGIHNASGLTTPDGMPLVWCCRWAGVKGTNRVYGPDLMLAMAARSAEKGWKWYLYGGAEGVANQVSTRLGERFPHLEIVGTYTPPFRPLTAPERDEVVSSIEESGADIVWVGLGTPKQERWMHEFRPLLGGPAALIGVGAAFNIHGGVVRQAPHWMQRSGLEWIFRTVVEPRRMVPRYLRVVPTFLAMLLRRRPFVRPAAPAGLTDTLLADGLVPPVGTDSPHDHPLDHPAHDSAFDHPAIAEPLPASDPLAR
jgi:N-acetylglucosaminyldiphosphoundecaprenol N-acetyl-beta-D-mannosaminyltransferase